MGILILVLIIGFWLYNYMKFRSMISYYSKMCGIIATELRRSPVRSRVQMLRFSSALIHSQQYLDAYELLVQLNHNVTDANEEQQIRANIEFCKNPIPWISQPQNLNHSYWHNFLLVRFGKIRYNFLTEEDYLRTNAILRNQ